LCVCMSKREREREGDTSAREGGRERGVAKNECRCGGEKRPGRLIALRDAINSAADGTGPDRSTSFAAAW
jgi:hypothetical protein